MPIHIDCQVLLGLQQVTLLGEVSHYAALLVDVWSLAVAQAAESELLRERQTARLVVNVVDLAEEQLVVAITCETGRAWCLVVNI